MKKPKYYSQLDKRWAHKLYRVKGKEKSTIGGSGCGPACAAMVIATLKKPTVTPVTTCNWSMKNGYKAVGQGTFYTYFRPQFKAYGINCYQVTGANSYGKNTTTSDKEAKKALKDGKWVIACMGPGRWTRSGHFVLAYGLSGDYVLIQDPASLAKNRRKALIKDWQKEAKYYWIIELPKPKPPAKKPVIPAPKPLPKPKPYKAKVTAKILNVRSGNGTKYKIVDKIKKGKIVTVYDEKGEWVRIHKTKNRWVAKKWLRKVT